MNRFFYAFPKAFGHVPSYAFLVFRKKFPHSPPPFALISFLPKTRVLYAATWDVGTAERCISLRNRCITFIDTSHDKSKFRYSPSSVNFVDTFPPRGRLFMGLRFAYLISPLLFTNYTPDFHCNALHFFGWAGGHTHFGFIKIKKSGNSLLAFCPYRGLVRESPPRTTDSSKMCHFASLEVRLMRIKNLSARRQFLPTASKFPHNVWSENYSAKYL